ncbi:MAG TPA: hypothetical protein VGE52_12845 [Pirellulales bacterium]
MKKFDELTERERCDLVEKAANAAAEAIEATARQAGVEPPAYALLTNATATRTHVAKNVGDAKFLEWMRSMSGGRRG